MSFTLSACPAYRSGDFISTSPFTDVYPRQTIEAKSVAELIAALNVYKSEVEANFDGGFEAHVYCGRDQRKPRGYDAAMTERKLRVYRLTDENAPPKILHSILGTPIHL